jgi:hypothetical protein
MITFSSIEAAFSSGGNRLCFVDPDDDRVCIKLARPERSPEKKRAAKSFPGNLRSLAYFDENVSDMSVYRHIKQSVGASAYQMIPKCYGYVDTNFGKGLAFEMIKDSDSKISLTLKQYVWQHGWTESLKAAVDQFLQRWQTAGMPSRNLLLHNIVVQQTHHADSSEIQRLVVIDGLGWPDIIPLGYYIKSLARFKAKRKSSRLKTAINALIEKRNSGGDWGIRGWMDEEQRK